MKDYTKELGHPDTWSERDKKILIKQFRKAPQLSALSALSDREILKLAKEHWKFQNGVEAEEDVTVDYLEAKIRKSRQEARKRRGPGQKI